jgi:hypothetical protein
MPIRYEFDHVRGRLLTRADGLLTFHDINAHLDAEQRKRDLGLAELFDARSATTDLTTEQVRRLVDRVANMLRDASLGATAVVTTSPSLYGMARMYAWLAERAGLSAAVFRDVRAASRWLDEFGNHGD